MDFTQAEKRFRRLKGQFEAGTLSETEFKAKLDDLMIRDEQGNWWIIGYQTERWYRYDGKEWVQTGRSVKPSQKSGAIPGWTVVFWIALGLAGGSAIGIAVGLSLFQRAAWTVALASGGAVSGAIGGFSIASALRAQNILTDWRGMLWITLAWTIGSLIGGAFSVAISWTIGGFGTAIALRIQNAFSGWESMLWIILGWAGGSAIGWIVSGAISRATAGDLGWVIGWAAGGALGGAAGAFVMIWQLQKAK